MTKLGENSNFNMSFRLEASGENKGNYILQLLGRGKCFPTGACAVGVITETADGIELSLKCTKKLHRTVYEARGKEVPSSNTMVGYKFPDAVKFHSWILKCKFVYPNRQHSGFGMLCNSVPSMEQSV